MDTLSVMDEELRSLMDRLRDEAAAGPPDPAADHRTAPDPAAYGPAAYDLLVATDDHEVLARVLVEPGRPLWAREIAAFRLGCAGDRRAFEALVLLLNHRDPERCVSAAHALARLNDPRTPGPPPHSPPTPCAPRTPCTRCACSPPCAPPRRSPPWSPPSSASWPPATRTGTWPWPAWRASAAWATPAPARSSRRPFRTHAWAGQRRRRWDGCRGVSGALSRLP